MKKFRGLLFILIVMIMGSTLMGCNANKSLEYGVYINSSNSLQEVVIDEKHILFNNVNFDEFNLELENEFGIDFKLTEKFSNQNKYVYENGQIDIKIASTISIKLEYDGKTIIVNNEKYKLKD